MRGMLIGGAFGEILARQKADVPFELGELLVVQQGAAKQLLQVYDLLFASQLPMQQLEYISGMQLEEGMEFQFMEPELRNYTVAKLKGLATLTKGASQPKALPTFFSTIRDVTSDDLDFTVPQQPLHFGQLRSGSRALDVPITLSGEAVLSHHVLIAATTGRGKSNLVRCMLWDLAQQDFAGMLVLDPHDEYYNASPGLKDHPRKERIAYYSKNPLPGTNSLVLNLNAVRPSHFTGAVDWSSAQREALNALWRRYGKGWVEAVVLEKPLENFNEATLGVIRRRVMDLLDLDWDGERLHCDGAFRLDIGESTVGDICTAIAHGRIVIVDTSSFDGRQEILIGSIIAQELFRRYRRARAKGERLPVASIILEEAPRVLGKEVLERGRNIFSTIAREGRKFRVGLVAITQLPSLIPREILANMNTKVILGIEMKPERQAIIESAAQDLSADDRSIASLNKGEAIITSNFAPFALPVKIPLFDTVVEKRVEKRGYPGL